jgi:hypothetical protein
LIVLETEGWAALDGASREVFEELLEGLQRAEVALLRRRDHPWIEALEQAVADGRAVCNAITGWENRWAMRNLVDQHPDGVSPRAKATLAKAEAMAPDDYRAPHMERATAQLRHAAVAPLADAIVTLSCPGPARCGPATCRASRWPRVRPATSSSTRPARCCSRRRSPCPCWRSAGCRSASSSWASSMRTLA